MYHGVCSLGKTEASKHVISFLIQVNQHITSDAGRSMAHQTTRIKDVILDSSVVFEAFGNAKTVRNDNSSRFGKYIKLQYTDDNGLISADTETFLLEKSRLVSVGGDERNYHVFYQLLRGIDSFEPDLKSEFSLTTVDDYKILTSGGCTIIRSVEGDVEEFQALYNALRNLGVSHDDLHDLWQILSIILHLGNSIFTDPIGGGFAKLEISTMSVDRVAELLGVPPSELLRCLTTQSINIAKRASVHAKTLTAAESMNNVLALIKWLYHHIFNWLLKSINHCHGALVTANRSPVKFLGILDIFGFEILGVNSFEQLCINFTNERLQHQFNHCIFASEQEVYINEGINWTTISYQDNQNVIDLIAKKPTGLLYILEEHCMMNRAPDDMALLGQINQTHGDRADKIYIKSRFVKDTIFTIKHFAGGVTYRIDNFISKNNDALQDDLTELMHTSTNSFLRKLIDNPTKTEVANIPKGQQRKAFAAAITVSLRFRGQLDSLIATLRATEPHYIKCIKPNDVKSAGIFQAPLTMSQLRYSGILEVVRIRREGFPIRIKFTDFYTRYEIFSRLKREEWKRPESCSEVEAKDYSEMITSQYLPLDSYQYGKNLLFIREYGLNLMTLAVSKYATSYAIKIQKIMRGYLAVKHYDKAKIHILHIQCRLRKFISKCRLIKLRIAKRRYEAELERQRLAELARQEAERRRLEEERYELFPILIVTNSLLYSNYRRKQEEERRQREEERLKREEAERQQKLREAREEAALRQVKPEYSFLSLVVL
jgi:myosin V